MIAPILGAVIPVLATAGIGYAWVCAVAGRSKRRP
jgi:hypothetical protein